MWPLNTSKIIEATRLWRRTLEWRCALQAVIYNNLIYFAYDVFSDSVSNRLAVLIHSMVANDAFINHNTQTCI